MYKKGIDCARERRREWLLRVGCGALKLVVWFQPRARPDLELQIICLSQPYMNFVVPVAHYSSTLIPKVNMAADDSETHSKKRSRSDDDGKPESNSSRTLLIF